MASRIPLPTAGAVGEQADHTATATCYCGAVQLQFPVEGPDMVTSFICNCTDCRKITASMFASNFVVRTSAVRHNRGAEKLSQWHNDKTIESGNTMDNHFCSVCGTLMYRVSSGMPDALVMRIGTVDDFALHETKLRPRVEQYTKDRVEWLEGAKGIKQVHGSFFGAAKDSKM